MPQNLSPQERKVEAGRGKLRRLPPPLLSAGGSQWEIKATPTGGHEQQPRRAVAITSRRVSFIDSAVQEGKLHPRQPLQGRGHGCAKRNGQGAPQREGENRVRSGNKTAAVCRQPQSQERGRRSGGGAPYLGENQTAAKVRPSRGLCAGRAKTGWCGGEGKRWRGEEAEVECEVN